jgi:hypothetical protein
MPDRNSLLSSASVGVAIIGSAIGDQLLSLAGPVLALLVHIWTEQSRKKAIATDDPIRQLEKENLRFWRQAAVDWQARCEAAARELERFRKQSEPVAITPPFPPGEASTDA